MSQSSNSPSSCRVAFITFASCLDFSMSAYTIFSLAKLVCWLHLRSALLLVLLCCDLRFFIPSWSFDLSTSAWFLLPSAPFSSFSLFPPIFFFSRLGVPAVAIPDADPLPCRRARSFLAPTLPGDMVDDDATPRLFRTDDDGLMLPSFRPATQMRQPMK